jgi:hypothetical protein
MKIPCLKKWVTFFCLTLILLSCKKEESPPEESDAERPLAPGYLCIYYGYPSLINNAGGDLNKAVEEFARFNLIVLGDGLWKDTHTDNSNTKTIISGLLQKKRLVFGYVDLGVSTHNLSEELLKQYISGWKKMGVNGIFFDDAGFDYKVTRERQNMVISYCRSLNLSVFMNAWEPDDVLPVLTEKDYYLAESFLVGHDKYLSLDAWKIKADKCHDYMLKNGTRIACLATGGENISADFNKYDKFSMAWAGTAMYNFHYFQATNSIYSANNNTAYFFPNLIGEYGKQWKQKEGIIKENDSHYSRETDSHTLHVYGNGSTEGYGKITNK